MNVTPIRSTRIINVGLAQITGTASRLGVAGSYRVRLFARDSAHVIAECWSGANGTYRFTCLEVIAGGYFSIAFDHNAEPVNAAVSDLLTPELPA